MSNPVPPRTPPSRTTQGSASFDRIVPIALVVLGAVTILLILLALGILFGLIRF